MALTAPSQSNTYVPEATDKLVVDYSRNISKFPLNQYVQIVPVDKQTGLYLEINREEAGRIMSDGQTAWPDGHERPKHHGELEDFQFKPYTTKRKSYGFNVGNLSVEQATWDVVASNAGVTAEKAMRKRTNTVIANATNAANYDSSHASAVSGGSIPGTSGSWDLSTTARKDIKRCIDYAVEKIIIDSLNGVDAGDLALVVSLGCARKMSISQEFIDYIKGSPHALAEIHGELPNPNKRFAFGLPATLYGLPLVIEDTAKTTTRKGASSVGKTTVLNDATPFVCSRVGGLVSDRNPQAPAFSTHVLFMKEEMVVEQFVDPENRRTKHYVTEDYEHYVVAPVAGFLFQGAVTV